MHPTMETPCQGGLAILNKQTKNRFYPAQALPVSVILGTRDTLVPVSAGQNMQELAPEITLNIIDRPGHVPFLSHPQEVLKIISRFMMNGVFVSVQSPSWKEGLGEILLDKSPSSPLLQRGR